MRKIILFIIGVFAIGAVFYTNQVQSMSAEATEAEIHRFYQILLKNEQIVADGDLLVEKVDDYYAVTFPSLAFKTSFETWDIGIVAANVSEDDNVLTASIALPNEIAVYNTQNQVVRKITLGTQQNTVRWRAGQIIPDYIAMKLTDTAVEDVLFDMAYGVQEIDILSDQGTDGTQSKVSIAVKNLMPQNAQELQEIPFKIGALNLEYDISGLKNSWLAPLEALLEKGSALNFGTIPIIEFEKIHAKMMAQDIRLPHFPFGGGRYTIKTAHAEKDFTMNGKGEISGVLKANMERDGAYTTTMLNWYPQKATMAMSMDHMPYRAFYEKIFPEQMAQFQNNGTLSKQKFNFFDLFADQSSKMALDQLEMVFPNGAELRGKGLVRHEDGATMNAVGDVMFEMKNIGNFITDIQKTISSKVMQAMNPGARAAENPGVTGMSAFMLMPLMNLMGKDHTDELGDTVKQFHFELSRDGNFTLNGAPVNGFLPKSTQPQAIE